MPFPKRAEVEAKLSDLIAGRCTRADAASWAQPWVIMKNPPVDDWGVWETLKNLSGADLLTDPTSYLFGKEDFENWLEEFRSTKQ